MSTPSQKQDKAVKTVSNPNYEHIPLPDKPYTSFRDFYPFYLGEHRHPVNRVLHILGTSSGLAIGIRLNAAIIHLVARILNLRKLASRTRAWSMRERDILKWMLLSFVQGYAVAWVGHFLVEKNRPATFKYPLYSLMGDFVMLWQVVTRQRRLL